MLLPFSNPHSLRVLIPGILVCLGARVLHGAPPEAVEVIIQFANPPRAAEHRLVEAWGGTVKRSFRIVNAVSATLPAVAVERLGREAGVLAVELDGKVEAHDLSKTWGVRRIGSGPVHAGTFGENVAPVLGTGVKVAIIDSGIDYHHPELSANYAGGYNFVKNNANPYDDDGHGTHVAGTVAALRNHFGAVGVAPEVSLYAIKVLGADGSGSWSWIIAGLEWCVDNGIEVANFSLGSSGHPGRTVERAFTNAGAAGLLMIASAGNDGEGSDTVSYPARFPTVIAVASTTSSDKRSGFSSTGPAVELAAPGSSIYSTLLGGGFGYMSGTSMAAPHVTGAAALVIAAGIVDGNGDGNINDDVRALLQMSADDLGPAGVDEHFGHGLVNAEFAALLAYNRQEAAAPAEPQAVPETVRPDGQIGARLTGLKGRGVYSDSATRQRVAQTARSAHPLKWHIRFAAADSASGEVAMRARVPHGNRRYRLTYLRRVKGELVNASAALRVGFVDTLHSDGHTQYQAIVRPRRRAPGRWGDFHFHIRGVSNEDPSKVDRVNGVVRNRSSRR